MNRFTTWMWVLIAAAALVAGCTHRGLLGEGMAGEPMVRVRLEATVNQLRVGGPRQAKLVPLGAGGAQTVNLPATLQLINGRWHINGVARPELGRAALEIRRSDRTPLSADGIAYPGDLRLIPLAQPDRFDVINLVNLEAYLPGVLKNELYPDWRLAAFHAQAIAARSYTIHRLQTADPSRTFDLEANPQTAQAYAGLTSHSNSIRGVRETAGLVLAQNNKVVPAFYSSTCGGVGASPEDAWGEAVPFSCLTPRPRKPCCTKSPYFSWGPIYVDTATLSRRVAAWGQTRGHTVGGIALIRNIVVERKTALGRPTRFGITDVNGRHVTMVADNFRAACNYTSNGAVPLPDNQRLKSTLVTVAVSGRQVIFNYGRGYGHGIGLCQFGAEQFAQQGWTGKQILELYYPGAKIQRAY